LAIDYVPAEDESSGRIIERQMSEFERPTAAAVNGVERNLIRVCLDCALQRLVADALMATDAITSSFMTPEPGMAKIVVLRWRLMMSNSSDLHSWDLLCLVPVR
jgi:hypothetical protein